MFSLAKRNLQLIFIFSSTFILRGQETPQEEHWFGAGGHFGFVIAHHESMQYLVRGHVPGFEINISKTTVGQKKWQRTYHCPEIGLSAFFIFLSNPKQLGYGINLHPYINFPMIRHKRFGLKFKTSLSMAYLSKIFDPVNNFKNSAVGSHLNGSVNLRLNAHSLLTEKLRLEYGLGLTHFSNGAFKMPNLGVNIPTLNMGLAYKFESKAIPVPVEFPESTVSKNVFIFWLGGFRAEVEPPTPIGYSAFTLSGSYDRLGKNKHRFIAGAEMGYNGGNEPRLKGDTIYIKKKSDLLQGGIKVGYALRVGNLEFPIEFGYYIHTLYKGNGVYFHRLGLRYYLPNNLVINGTLKTHWAKAEYWEFGLGYVLGSRNKKQALKKD